MDNPIPLRLNGRAVDLERGIVVDKTGQRTTLRPQVADVLKLLAARPGEVVGKDELMQAVWGRVAVTDDSLVQCIKDIRKALGDDEHEIVRTIHKRGYLLEPARPEPAASPRWRRGIALVAGAAALVALVGVSSWLLDRSAAGRPAIAVLPFESLDGDAKWTRFADGLTDDIITDLARFRDIPVVARTSAEVYGGTPRDVREIGRALDVDYVLEGSLQVDGYRMRVTAQLIDTRTGVHVWSERYDRDAADFFPMQDEITEKIAVTLTGWQGQIIEAERALARRKTAADLDAYDYWLLGIEAKHKMTPPSQREARAYFEKGLQLDPDFMPLLRDMAVTHSVDWDIGSTIDFPASVAAHRTYIERAMAIDPNDANANFQMGVAYVVAGDEAQAERDRERALQLAPNNADILMCLAWSWGGWQTERAIALLERIRKLDPRHPAWWNFPVAYTFFAARRFDEAYAAAARLGESPSQAAFLAMSAAQLGRKEEAATAAAKVLRMRPDWTAESMFPYQNFEDETLLPESAAKAGLPVCMTTAQLSGYTGGYRLRHCEEERMRTTSN